MKKLLAVLATSVLAGSAFASDKIIVEFAYPYSHLFDVTYEKILPKFYEQHPDIEVKMRATYESYEDGTNTILREAVAGTLPDVTMQGLNRQAILVEKGIAKSLEPWIAKESDFAKDGYHKAMLDLGTFAGEVHGLPFSISLPVGYYNMEVMAKAGYNADNLPTSWPEVIEACGKLRDAGVANPMFWGWNITGNWFLQALMWSQDEPTVNGADFRLDEPSGLTALNTMKNLFRGCDMQNLEWKAALASFSAGEIGMMYWSTSAVGAVERAMGDFTLVTNEYPGLDDGSPLGLPAGGNSAMMVSTSENPEELEAAWKWLKFITSGEGAADVARTTGYMPPNQAANEIILKDFYQQNPAKATAVRQLPLLREWQAYPGDNGLAATQVIYDGIEGIVTGEYDDMEELQAELAEEVQELLTQ
ncbi:MAG: extracellular solute-binding protein [Gammaproteobacteria bacterium]|nr:extracellular solute-binding protein [Gammaproteobacteria bacterium]